MLLRDHYCDATPALDSKSILALFDQQNFDDISHDYLNYYSGIIHLSLGAIDKASEHSANINDPKSGFKLALQAAIALLTTQFELANALFRKALPALRRQFDTKTYYFDNIIGIFHNLCMT